MNAPKRLYAIDICYHFNRLEEAFATDSVLCELFGPMMGWADYQHVSPQQVRNIIFLFDKQPPPRIVDQVVSIIREQADLGYVNLREVALVPGELRAQPVRTIAERMSWQYRMFEQTGSVQWPTQTTNDDEPTTANQSTPAPETKQS